ncbi:MAG: chitobiase/beta-hexosaminidase C-terminal domain-containing protein, partial [Actinobacteria bacterium]|nr:chitobiase/beta-hexosaminidase C-terminal domain-containing protein [Actinomycetota bacterium]
MLAEGIGAVFLRRVFTAAEMPATLVLEVSFDDGFVAFLNGIEVASVNRPEEERLTFASTAAGSHEARLPERFDLTPFRDALQVGENVLAMALLNQRPTSNDLSLIPQLGTVPPVFHTSFRLNILGETVLLSNSRGEILDQVEYPGQSPDQSYGRSPDGTGSFLYHLHPTPLGPNTGPANREPLVVAAVTFRPDHGFYDAPFDATIAVETPGAEIRYTTDGSAPTETTGTVYTEPLRVADTTVLRVAAFKPGHRPSPVTSCTYIFLETPAGGGVVNQPRDPAGFPRTWGSAGAADYAMDPRVATDTTSPFYDPRVKDALLALPALSIVTESDHLFDPRTGIYSNPQQ